MIFLFWDFFRYVHGSGNYTNQKFVEYRIFQNVCYSYSVLLELSLEFLSMNDIFGCFFFLTALYFFLNWTSVVVKGVQKVQRLHLHQQFSFRPYCVSAKVTYIIYLFKCLLGVVRPVLGHQKPPYTNQLLMSLEMEVKLFDTDIHSFKYNSMIILSDIRSTIYVRTCILNFVKMKYHAPSKVI